MIRHVKASCHLIANFESFDIVHVPKEKNIHVDALASLGSASGTVTYLEESIIEASKLKEMLNVEEPSEDWCKEIIDYLKRSMLPYNRIEPRKIKIKTARYVRVLGELY